MQNQHKKPAHTNEPTKTAPKERIPVRGGCYVVVASSGTGRPEGLSDRLPEYEGSLPRSSIFPDFQSPCAGGFTWKSGCSPAGSRRTALSSTSSHRSDLSAEPRETLRDEREKLVPGVRNRRFQAELRKITPLPKLSEISQ